MGCQLWGESCSGSAAQRRLGLLCGCAAGLGYTPHHAWPAGWKERRTAGLVNPIKTFELEVCFAGNRHLSNLPSNLTFHSLLSSWDGRPKCRNHRGPVFFL